MRKEKRNWYSDTTHILSDTTGLDISGLSIDRWDQDYYEHCFQTGLLFKPLMKPQKVQSLHVAILDSGLEIFAIMNPNDFDEIESIESFRNYITKVKFEYGYYLSNLHYYFKPMEKFNDLFVRQNLMRCLNQLLDIKSKGQTIPVHYPQSAWLTDVSSHLASER